MFDVYQLFNKELGLFMYKYYKNLLPRAFDNMFVDMKSVHNYNTRGKNNYRQDIHKLTSILSVGPRIWNFLPKGIKEASSISTFKKYLTHHLKEEK